jgi:hypothetical protein
MALVDTAKGTQIQIQIDNQLTGTSQAYQHPCMINTTRGIQMQTSGTDEEVPDCANPDLMAWNLHTKTGITLTATGAGMLNKDDIPAFWAWLIADTAKVTKLSLGGDTIGGVITIPMKLIDFSITGDRGKVAACTMTIKSHGGGTYGTS